VTVPLGPMNGDPQMRNSIAVQSNAAKGALYASMVVFGGTAVPSVQLLGRDSMQPYNGGAHPWTTATGAASTLVMFNYSIAPQTFFVAIASGGVLWQQKYQLAALETKTLDIGSLIATGAKDENGLVLPAAATAGVAQWFTPNFGQGAGRLLVSQPGIGLARSFGCQNMAVLGGTSSMPNNNVTVAAGSSGQMGPYQVGCYMGQVGFCGGTYAMTAPWSTNWTSSNPSVASIPTPSGPTTATINGNLAGSAGITAAGITQEYNYQPLDLQWWCTAPPQTGTVTVVNVTLTCGAPSLALGSPLSAAPQSSTSGSCTAAGSPAGGTYSWSASKSTITVSGNGASATYTAASASSAVGDTAITVTYTYPNSNPVSATSAVTVYQPASLSGSTVTQTGTQQYTLPCLAKPNTGSCSVVTNGQQCSYTGPVFTRNYNVVSQFSGVTFASVGLSQANVAESVQIPSGSNGCSISNPVTGGGSTSSFPDTYAIYSSCCESGGPGCTTTANQTITVNGFAMAQETITTTCTTATATP